MFSTLRLGDMGTPPRQLSCSQTLTPPRDYLQLQAQDMTIRDGPLCMVVWVEFLMSCWVSIRHFHTCMRIIYNYCLLPTLILFHLPRWSLSQNNNLPYTLLHFICTWEKICDPCLSESVFISLNMIASISTHFPANDTVLFLLMVEW